MNPAHFSTGGWVGHTVLTPDKTRVALLIAVVSVLASVCGVPLGRTGTAAPVVRPHPDAPVTVEIAAAEFTVSNNTGSVIYHVVFPAEILPRIEWAPCLEPERCDPGLRIDAGEQKTYRIDNIADGGTNEIVVFWWRLLKNAEGGYEPPEIQELWVPLE